MNRNTPTPLVIAKDPKLRPSMLAPRPGRRLDRYPFNDPSVRYFYLGRSAGYALTRALGLSGKEILFPAWFDGPAVAAMRRAGATPGFYPVHDGARVDPAEVAAAITPRTGAVCLIHFVGFPGPVNEVRAICRERGLLLIEDCAHALFSTLDGQPIGTFGDGAIFSLYKWLPVPNGGAMTMTAGDPSAVPAPTVVSRTSGVALSAFSLLDSLAMRCGMAGRALRSGIRAIGRTTSHAAGLSYIGTGGIVFRDDELDYAMSGVSHRILAGQDVDAIVAGRRRNYELLSDLLSDVAPPLQGRLPAGVTPLFYPTRVPSKRAVLARLRARGIEGRNFWEYSEPMLPAGLFPEMDELRRTVLELPIHQDVTPERIEWMARIVREELGAAVPSRRVARPRPGERAGAVLSAGRNRSVLSAGRDLSV
jgi:dTDP-4-amino-4,6-dideoxygalactose transaminase